MTVKMAKVSVLFDVREASCRASAGINAFERQIGEMLAHLGIPFRWLSDPAHLESEPPDIVIAALAADDERTVAVLRDYADKGGTIIAYAGLDALADDLGCRVIKHSGAHYAWLEQADSELRQLRCFQPVVWVAGETEETQVEEYGDIRAGRPEGVRIGAALQRFPMGKGSLDRWTINIPWTAVSLQQGIRPVTGDGSPAPDGSANLNDGMLKADDGFELDWCWDRAMTSQGTPYFHHPYADYWREALVAHLLKTADRLKLTLPFIGFWPDGVPHMALISFDSDINTDESAETTLRVLKECGIQSTWCMIEPGYSSHIYEQAIKDGHELALHYNAVIHHDGKWSREEFDRQFLWMLGATRIEKVISNKNHYTRFEGWGELFRWCEDKGIEVDQSRGSSKLGNTGFPFGTCHPFFPISWHDESNRFYDVLEIGFMTQDLDCANFGDRTVVEPFLQQVSKVDGIAHFLFHQVHIHKQEIVRNAFRMLIDKLHSYGFVCWTSSQINEWERARRKIRIEGVSKDGQPLVRNDVGHPGVIVWVPQPVPQAGVDSTANDSNVAIRYGLPCRKWVIS